MLLCPPQEMEALEGNKCSKSFCQLDMVAHTCNPMFRSFLVVVMVSFTGSAVL